MIEPVRLTLVELGPVPGAALGFRYSALGFRYSVLVDSAGVGGPEDSVDAGVRSKGRLGRGRRMRGCSVMVTGFGGGLLRLK
jgi:hypothetical protein